jgi:DNA-binding CsgD family transcriptional regulator
LTRVEVPRLGVNDALVGRGPELSLIVSFLDRAASDGEALIVLGEPGVGKTALLEAGAEAALAAGCRVLRAAGVEFEAEVTFSGLHQVLLPLHQEIAHLDVGHRRALNVALGFGEGPAPDRLVICNATLSILGRAARAQPVLVIVDDLHWLDRASAGVLGFVARRLAGNRVGFLAAARTGEESFFERAGLREIEVGPLDETAASELMSARFPALALAVRQRLLAEAQGNPLAVLELPVALSRPQRAALQALPALLPLTRRLQALFRSRVGALPERPQRLLLLMALDASGDVRLLQATGDHQQGLDELAVAERARLASLNAHRLTFRHPLIRSAVVELSTVVERRRAHATLAELWADQPDRHVWHLAEATVGRDEHVASLLEEAGDRVLRRGDGVGAVNTLVRAAELSPNARDRARRLAEAAYIGAHVTGELQGASQLLADARRADPERRDSLEAATTAASVLLNADGDVDTAHRLLVGAIEAHEPTRRHDLKALEDAAETLLMVCHYGCRPELFAPLDRLLARLGPELPQTLALSSKTLSDPVRTARPVIEQLEDAIAKLRDEADPTLILRTAIAAFYVYRLSDCREALWRVVRDGREGGAIASGIRALALLAFDGFLCGEWDQASQLADEVTDLCEATGYRFLNWAGQHTHALLAAGRGDHDRTSRIAREIAQTAAPRGIRSVAHYALHAQALAALGRGDYDEAYRHATAISPAGTFASHVYAALHVPMIIVEAAIHTGRQDEAAAHVKAMRDADIAGLSSRLALLAAGSYAIAAADDSAPGLFEEALAVPDADRWPFELARIQLAYGERLRRTRTITQSRLHLTAALEIFEALSARPWATRAANELRATGQTRHRAGERERDELTPQELEIATLAATGLSNKQIGERLFLSHRTVAAHLYRTFPKLGITSRAALRDALVVPPDDGNHAPVGHRQGPR